MNLQLQLAGERPPTPTATAAMKTEAGLFCGTMQTQMAAHQARIRPEQMLAAQSSQGTSPVMNSIAESEVAGSEAGHLDQKASQSAVSRMPALSIVPLVNDEVGNRRLQGLNVSTSDGSTVVSARKDGPLSKGNTPPAGVKAKPSAPSSIAAMQPQSAEAPFPVVAQTTPVADPQVSAKSWSAKESEQIATVPLVQPTSKAAPAPALTRAVALEGRQEGSAAGSSLVVPGGGVRVPIDRENAAVATAVKDAPLSRRPEPGSLQETQAEGPVNLQSGVNLVAQQPDVAAIATHASVTAPAAKSISVAGSSEFKSDASGKTVSPKSVAVRVSSPVPMHRMDSQTSSSLHAPPTTQLSTATNAAAVNGYGVETRRQEDPHAFTREMSAARVLQRMDMAASPDAVPLRADARHLDVGIQSAFGWLEVRATTGASGRIDATLQVQSSGSAESLATHSDDIANYARQQSIEMGRLSVGVSTGGGGQHHSHSSDHDGTQLGTPTTTVRSSVDTSDTVYRVSDTLSIISLRA